MKRSLTIAWMALAFFILCACSATDSNNEWQIDAEKRPHQEIMRLIIISHANIVRAKTIEINQTATNLTRANIELTKNPNLSAHALAKDAWLETAMALDFLGPFILDGDFASRQKPCKSAINETFNDVDSAECLANRIMAWPIDEGYIDYTYDNEYPAYASTAGVVINDTTSAARCTSDGARLRCDTGIINLSPGTRLCYSRFERGNITIGTSGLRAANQCPDRPGEDQYGNLLLDDRQQQRISTGIHALEFLLWGSDITDTETEFGPGPRLLGDFSAAACRIGNCKYRNNYLKAAGTLLKTDLTVLAELYSGKTETELADMGALRAALIRVEPEVAIARTLTSYLNFIVDELAYKRLALPLKNRDQRLSKTQFSDLEYDLFAQLGDVLSLPYDDQIRQQNIGGETIESISEYGLHNLISPYDPRLDQQIRSSITSIAEQAQTLQITADEFDRVIKRDDSDIQRRNLIELESRLITLAGLIVEGANIGFIDLSKVRCGEYCEQIGL